MLRNVLLRGLSSLALLAVAGPARAQFLGSTPITLVMPYPPGGLGDYLARLVAKKLSEQSGVSVVVENKAGANGAIGAAVVANAKPDGHTLLCVPASTLTTNPWLMKGAGYDPVKDFTPLARGIEFPNVLMVNRWAATRAPSCWRTCRSSHGSWSVNCMRVSASDCWASLSAVSTIQLAL